MSSSNKQEVKRRTQEIKRLKSELWKSVEREAFERAAELRDLIKLRQAELLTFLVNI